MIKSFNEYIEEINEGKILDTIKTAISKVSKAPDKYIKFANEKIEDLKVDDNLTYKKIDKDIYTEMLDKINNDDFISKLFKYGKKAVNFGGIYRKYILEKKTDSDTMSKLFKDLDDKFECDGDNSKLRAVLDVLDTLMIEYWDLKDKHSSSDSSSRSYSSSSSSSKNVARYTSIAAATMMMRK